jgi:hypothetical protein
VAAPVTDPGHQNGNERRVLIAAGEPAGMTNRSMAGMNVRMAIRQDEQGK